jgi:hypothetical protein
LEASNFAKQSRQVVDNMGEVCGFEQIQPNLGVADGRLRITDLQAEVAGPFPIDSQSAIANREIVNEGWASLQRTVKRPIAACD